MPQKYWSSFCCSITDLQKKNKTNVLEYGPNKLVQLGSFFFIIGLQALLRNVKTSAIHSR